MVFNPFRRKSKAESGKPATVQTAVQGPLTEKEQRAEASEQKGKGENLPALVRKAHRTEKATAAQALNQYVFQVELRANKTEVQKSVARHYRVHVEAVRMINAPGKERRVKGRPGWKSGYKKAIVTLRAGEKIEVSV